MRGEEALKLLRKGKLIRLITWKKRSYIYLHEIDKRICADSSETTKDLKCMTDYYFLGHDLLYGEWEEYHRR